MKELIAFIKQSMSEDNGRASSTRLNVFYSFIQWVPAITFGFIWCVVSRPELIIPYLSVLAALVGGILGIKVWQKKVEQNNEAEQ